MARKTGKRLRLQLFDAGNVLCPLCLSPFTREQVASGRTVTLEHVPPKFAGGRARCLTCKSCNAGTGRDVDQVAAMTKQPTKVTVDIQGKRDSFYITREGKELTPAFGGFTEEDILKLMNSKSREATMSVRVPKPEVVATAWLKAGYLAIFCLLGPGSGYNYARSPSAVRIRDKIFHPTEQKNAGMYVMDNMPGFPSADIFLIDEPIPCWMVRIGDKIVVLASNWEQASCPPLEQIKERYKGTTVELRGGSHWSFQTFGSFQSIDVHLEGADKMDSLVGMTIGGSLPGGERAEGTCIRHEGESATLLLPAGKRR